MEERKAAKELEMSRKSTCKPQGSSTVGDRKGAKEDRTGTDSTSKAKRRPTELQRAPRKTASAKKKTGTAEMTQRNAPRQWAAEEVSDTTVVTQSTGEKGSMRQRGVKKLTVKRPAEAAEVAQATGVQDFIALQYPSMDEGVSSTVRLGRAFVFGALGRRMDDPKWFDAAANITECSVRLLTTSMKAKAPVLVPPPNSIYSEMN